jgi:hypothetical protein
MSFECEHGMQRKKLAKAEVGKNDVFQNETERTRGRDLHETQTKSKKSKAVNCSYIQPAVSRKSSNADENANEGAAQSLLQGTD